MSLAAIVRRINAYKDAHHGAPPGPLHVTPEEYLRIMEARGLLNDRPPPSTKTVVFCGVPCTIGDVVYPWGTFPDE